MKIWLLLLASSLVCAAPGMAATKAAFAYSEGRTLTFADAQGRRLTTMNVRQEINFFAVDPSARHVVVETPGDYGGQLLWCSVGAKKCTRLTHGPYFYKSVKTYREVYTEPAFDPTGKHLAFAIRSVYRNPLRAKEEDAWELEGPIAVMNLSSKRVRILKSTTGEGSCLTQIPIWSPDGTRILVTCGEGGEITNVDGTHLLNLTSALEGPPLDKEMDMYNTQPLMWFGNNAILFLRARGSSVSDWRKGRVFELMLSSMKVRAVEGLGAIPASCLRGAWDLQMSNRLVFVAQRGGERKVYDRQTGKVVWSARNTSSHPVFAQLIAGDGSR